MNRWLLLGLAFLVRLCLPVQFQCLAPVMPVLVDDLGITYAQAGLLIGSFWLPGVALALPGGVIGARFGDKQTIVVCLAAMTTGAVVVAASGSLPLALVGRVLSGAGAVVLNVRLTKIVTDHFVGREIATAMGVVLASWPLGIAVTMASLGFVASRASWNVAVGMTAALTAVALVVTALLYRDTSARAAAHPTVWSISRTELLLVSAASTVWMLFNVSFSVVTSFTPLVLIARGHAVGEASAMVSVLSWASLFAVPFGGYLADRIRRPNAIIAGGALLSGVSVLVLVMPGPALPWILMFGLFGSLGPGAIMALPSEVLRPQARSTGLGVFYTVYYLGMLVFPPIAGWAQDRAGTAIAAVVFGASARLLTAGALAGFRVLQRRATAPPSSLTPNV